MGAGSASALPLGRVPVLHAIAGPEEAERPGFIALARRLLAGLGPDVAVHLRLPDASGRRLWELASALAAAAAGAGGWCAVNGRPEVALAAGAQAVQVGRRDLPLEETVRLVGGRLAVGASVHGAAEAARAAARGANYLLLGTIYATPSHPSRPGSGPGRVAEAVEALRGAGRADVPVVAIGGVDASRVAAVVGAGARGVAVRRAVWSADDPVAAARQLAARVRSSGTVSKGGAP